MCVCWGKRAWVVVCVCVCVKFAFVSRSYACVSVVFITYICVYGYTSTRVSIPVYAEYGVNSLCP